MCKSDPQMAEVVTYANRMSTIDIDKLRMYFDNDILFTSVSRAERARRGTYIRMKDLWLLDFLDGDLHTFILVSPCRQVIANNSP